MDLEFKKKQSVLTKYHIDPDTKKPITVPVVEKQQVHPLKNLIQMVGEVKKNKKIQIIDRDMIPVNKPEKITQPYHYYVDYEQNLIHFHPDIAGQTVEYKYEDMGVTVISANKIFTKQDEKGNVIELLEDIIRLGREAIDVMETIGGVAIVMKRLEDDIKEGYEVSDKIQADIQQAKDEILSVRGNKEVIIKSSDWTLNVDVYEKEITHDLNSENLHVTARNSDTKEAVTIGYKILDKTRILLKSDEAINMSVVLSASYYHATQTISDDIAEEVVKSRKGETSLDVKITKIDEQLDNKATYFENISAMKSSNKVKINTICKTLGYYKSGDGGGAIYRITDNPPLENAFSFSISKGLTAELLFSDEISIKQLGARDYDEEGNKVDIKPFIDIYISKTNPINNPSNTKTIKLFIPAGRWFSSPFKLQSSSVYIYGVNVYSYPYATGTILMPLENNQSHLWVIGDDTTDNAGLEYGNIALKSLMFSTHNPSQNDGIYVGGLTADKCYVCNKLLHISRVYGAVFENIHFTNYIGTPLTICSSNESIFDDFTFRNGDAFETGNVVFDTDIIGNKNISACFFDKFSFEGVKGHLFVFRKDSKYINNKIGTILFEDREVKISQDGEFTTYTVAEHGDMDFQSKSIFAINENSYCEINVDDILLNNFGRVIFTKDNLNYLFDTIVLEYGKISKGQVNIKHISCRCS